MTLKPFPGPGYASYSAMVLPLLAVRDRAEQPVEFLGTGFFVGKECLFATAYHCLPADDAKISVLPPGNNVAAVDATVMKTDRAADLALLKVDGYAPPMWFQTHDTIEVGQNLPMVCFEYSGTRVVDRMVYSSPATRMGNVTRRFPDYDLYGKAGEDMLELSFPALLGASGAPVLWGNTFSVVGIIKGNIGHHLIPVQIEEIHYPDEQKTEKIFYLLPQALAIHVKHLRVLLGQAPSKSALSY